MYKKTNTSLQVQPFVSLLALKIPTGRKHSGLKPFHTTSNTSCYMVSLESFTTYRHQKVVRKYFGFHLFCYIGTREERGKINCTKIINTRIPVIKPSLLLSFQMNVCLPINFPFCIFSAQVSYTKHKNFTDPLVSSSLQIDIKKDFANQIRTQFFFCAKLGMEIKDLRQ